MSQNLTQKLLTLAASLAIDLTEELAAKLVDYVLLLHKWNKAYNLTAVKTPEEMLTRHIVDSLLAKPFITGSNILDFGTGAGLPGIPLALTLPQQNLVLLDSNKKKIHFVQHVILTLGLKNARAIFARAEQFTPANCFNTIITRATTSLVGFVKTTNHLCCKDGQFLALKGPDPTAEITVLHNAFPALNVNLHKLPTYDINAAKTLVVIT